jgi:hypothetical protein
MNIFYTQVDTNLQKELNARARSGYDRTTGALNFMLGKYANVELSAYDGPGPALDDSNLVHVLGGAKSWGQEYNAGGQDGFLNPEKSTTIPTGTQWNWNPKEKKVWASQTTTTIGNLQLRIPPYISSADIQIGDNSMGLLNTANVVIEIPNAQRDLDLMEELYMRPGRYAKLKFIHDESTLASLSETRGLLSGSIPADKKLKELYPNVNLDEKKTEIRRMNQITFEGLITNFDFSYQKDFSVQLQIQLRGTSNVFTDVSMFIDAQGSAPGTATANPIADPAKYNQTIKFSDQTDSQKGKVDAGIPTGSKDEKNLKEVTIEAKNKKDRKSFYGQLFQQVEADYENSFKQTLQISTIEYFDPKNSSGPKTVKRQLNRLDKKTNTLHTDQYFLCGNAWSQSTPDTDMSSYHRYITLGYLIDFINSKVLRDTKEGKNTGKVTSNAQIVCSDKFCYSNYYPEICSTDPLNILLLPADSKRGTTETYGVKNTKSTTSSVPITEKKSFFKDTLSPDNSWPGFGGSASEPVDRMYPSRIFINLELIYEIITVLESSGNESFKVSDFLSAISNEIVNATSGAISLKLITHPEDQTVLAFYDENFIGTPKDKEEVREYTIPMTTTGTIVHDFQLKASLPENVSSLSYVLNQDPERISTEDIAPYINYMYNSTDPTKKTQAEKDYAKKHFEFKDTLNAAKIKFGETMTDPTLRSALDKAQKAYFQYPTPDIKSSVQLIAPIIPFDITFKIDGIQGFRYGDVLTFDVLPQKYRFNTVFSIVGVNHQVSQDSTWTTEVRCIMRPKVG